MSVQLKVIGGPHQGKDYQFLEHDSFIVGRGKQAHFRLARDDQYFSRVHFLIEVNPPECRLLDLGSRNGTRVNGRRVQSADLHDGDVISAGKTLIQVVIEPRTTSVPAIEEVISTPTVISRADGDACEAPAVSIPSSLDSAGLELLPGDSEPIFGSEVHDPHGYLPADYRARSSRHPQPITGYRLIQELGRGGMGTVYLAVREQDQSIVAVKTILPGMVVNTRDQQRFLREAEILQQLLHPHIVACRGSGECDGLLYLSMEYVPGQGADALVRTSGGKLSISRAVRLIMQLLTALRYAHAEGFVHRDIKPSNLLIIDTGKEELLKLADFGLARAYQASGLSGLTMTGEISGTIGYMAPEQITDFRRAQPPSDQYAAAASLYYLLTGRFVYDFPDDPGKRLLMILDQEPVPIRSRQPEIPEGLAAAIHRALAHDVQTRFPDVRGFYAAIEPFSR